MRKKNQFYTDSEYMTDTKVLYIYNLAKFKEQKKKSQNHVHGFYQQ